MRKSLSTASALIRKPSHPLLDRLSWSISDAETATGLCGTTLKDAIKSGALPAYKIGRRTLLRPAEVERFLFRDRSNPQETDE